MVCCLCVGGADVGDDLLVGECAEGFAGSRGEEGKESVEETADLVSDI